MIVFMRALLNVWGTDDQAVDEILRAVQALNTESSVIAVLERSREAVDE